MINHERESIYPPLPHREISSLTETLSPLGVLTCISSGHHINTVDNGNEYCYIILDGYASCRSRDDGYVITYIYSNHLLGLGNLLMSQDFLFFRAESKVTALKINGRDALNAINSSPLLWRDVSVLLAYLGKRLARRYINLNVKNAYGVIKMLLLELDVQPEEVKNTISVVQFIQERTPLSRSRVMSILMELNKGEYILTRRGRLRSVKFLPEKF